MVINFRKLISVWMVLFFLFIVACSSMNPGEQNPMVPKASSPISANPLPSPTPVPSLFPTPMQPTPFPNSSATPSPSPIPTVTPAPTASPTATPIITGQTSFITQHSITWTFDREYPVGQFANGDYWVIGPVEILNVTPPQTPGKNGSVINPTVGGTQGYDSRAQQFNIDLRANPPPFTLNPEESLISTQSHLDDPNQPCHVDLLGRCIWYSHSFIQNAAVLTALSVAPPPGTFRPPFVGNDKPLYSSNSLNSQVLLNLPPVSGSPDIQQYARFFEGPWLTHQTGWSGRMIHPTERMPNYYREVYQIESEAALILNLDIPGKRELMINMIQHGIDNYQVALLGSGDRTISKFPILLAGLLLNQEAMIHTSYGFREIQQTYYGNGWTGATVLFRQNTIQPHEFLSPGQWQDPNNYPPGAYPSGGGCKAESYRRCCSSHTWPGMALAMRKMSIMDLFGHDAFFDYVDRWMSEDPATTKPSIVRTCGESWGWDVGRTGGSNFVNQMWDQYR